MKRIIILVAAALLLATGCTEREPTIKLDENGNLDHAAFEALLEALDQEQREELAQSLGGIAIKHLSDDPLSALFKSFTGEFEQNILAEVEGMTAEQVIEHAKPLPPLAKRHPLYLLREPTSKGDLPNGATVER